MSINYETMANYMRNITSELFIKDTVSKRPYYVNSASMQRRKPLQAQKQSKFSGQRGFTLLDIMAEQLPAFKNIGPYEVDTLIRFSNCRDGYLFFRGGSRSGKSSTIAFLEDYCNNYFLGTFQNKREIDPIKIIIADIGNYVSDLEEDKEPSLGYKKEEYERFMKKLYSMIISSCQRSFPDSNFYYDLCRLVYVDAVKIKFGCDIFSEVIERIRSNLNWPDDSAWNSISSYKKAQIVRGIFETCNEPTDLFIATIAPLWYYFNNAEKNTNHLTGILVIDNIDPLPTYFQQTIAEKIRAVCTTPTWAKFFNNKKFNIVIPVRLSTYKRRIGQIGGSFSSCEHASFYPSDILFFRLNYFFITQGNPFNLERIPIEYRNAIVLRLYALWSHLADRNGYFRTMIDSLSGTNINHANGFAQNWCLCNNFDKGLYYETDFLNKIFHNQIVYDAAIAFLNEFWFHTLRAIKWCLSNYYNTNETDQRTVIQMASNCGKIFSIIMGEIFRDNRVLCYPIDTGTIGTRRTIIHKLIEHIHEILYNQAETTMGNNIADRHASQIADLLSKFIEKKEICSIFSNCFVENVENNLLESLQLQCCQFSGYDQKLAELILGWMKKVFIVLKHKTASTFPNAKPFFIRNENGLPYSALLRKYAPKISRYEAGWHLLEPKGIEKEDMISAANVFVSDQETNPVAMHILYILYYSDELNMQTGNLVDLLQSYGYDYDKNIIPVMQNLIRIDRRLIFCDVNDYEYGIQKIIKERNMVIYLSNAGKGYFEDLIITPPYIQWCMKKFTSNTELHNMVQKVEAVYKKMVDIIENELKALRNIGGKPVSLSEHIPGYLCASLDVLIRALDHYIPGFIAHYKNISENQEMTSNTEKLISKIILDCQKYVNEISNLFFSGSEIANSHDTIISWHENIEWAKKHLLDKINLKVGRRNAPI